VQAAALVDATGRSASPARRLGSRRIVHDRLIGLVGFYPDVVGGACRDRRTLVEAVACGWWYTALLPHGGHVAAFMSDADRLPAGWLARQTFWRQWLEQAPHTQARLGSDPPGSGLRVVSAGSGRLRDVAGPGWLAVGDAALSFDPLSAQGVTWALESGLAAARALDASLRGDRRAVEDYASRAGVDFDAYLRARADYYARERRWPDSPFWRRRFPPSQGFGA
jgi:flavin-dependent dehydrogenase